MKFQYFAVRFVGDARYRVSRKCQSSSEAKIDTFGIDVERMVCVGFSRQWRNLPLREKTRIEVELDKLARAIDPRAPQLHAEGPQPNAEGAQS